MLDLILYVLLGATVLALGVWEGIVSAKSLPESENKPLHVWGIVGVGVVAFVLTIVVGMRGYYVQKDAATQQAMLNQTLSQTSQQLNKASATLEQSRLNEEFMKGQLSGLSMMVGRLDSGGSTGSANLAQTLRQMSGAAPHGIEPPAIQKMTNSQLRQKVIAFAQDMAKFSGDFIDQFNNFMQMREQITKNNPNMTEEQKKVALSPEVESNFYSSHLRIFENEMRQSYLGQQQSIVTNFLGKTRSYLVPHDHGRWIQSGIRTHLLAMYY